MKRKIFSLFLMVLMFFLFSPIVGYAETNYVAQIGTEKYETLTDAIASVTDTTPTTIKLLTDVINENLFVIGKEGSGNVSTLKQNITIDLNGYKIVKSDSTGAGSIFTIIGSGTLTIDDSSKEKTGLITSGSSGRMRGFDVARGTFVLKGGTITTSLKDTSWSGGGVNVWKQGEFIMEGGAIKDCKAGKHGGGVNVGTDTTNGSQITKGIFTMKGGTIKNCTTSSSSGWGGGVSNWTKFIMEGGTIEDNTASNGGGGVTTSADASFIMTGGTIKGNIAKGGNLDSSGGGVCGAGTLKIGGNAVIIDNKWNLATNNFYLRNGNFIELDNPSTEMNVGIVMQNGTGKFTTNGVAANSKAFIADKNEYAVKYNTSDYLELEEDTQAPTGEILFKEKSFTSFLNTITFGLFFKDKFDVTINANDNNIIKSIEYYISDDAMSLDDVKAITSWTDYEEFSIDSENKYVIYAKITDRANNVSYISSDGFIFDETLPVVSGINTNNGVYYTTQKFTVDEEYIDKVLINGEEVDNYVLPGNVDTTYEIDVYDKAGNTDYMSIRMLPISTIAVILEDINIDNVKYADKEDIEYIINKVNNIDTTYATDSEKEELQEIIDKCDLLLEAIKNKYISEVDLTITIPRAGQTIEDNTFEVISKYDNIVISAKEWRLNGGYEALSNDYLFEEDKLYIPILTVEIKNQTHYFDENTTLTIHGSNWSNGENTYKLKDYKDYGYVKELSDGSFIIDEMTISVEDTPVYEVIVGANQTYVIDKDKEALFRINAEYSLFEGKVFVDDVLLEQMDYTSEEGSTIIKLKKEFVDSLEVGKHTLKVEFNDGGKAITHFIIDVLNEDKPEIENNPKTGDNIVSYMIIGSLSLIGLAGCCVSLKRKRFN